MLCGVLCGVGLVVMTFFAHEYGIKTDGVWCCAFWAGAAQFGMDRVGCNDLKSGAGDGFVDGGPTFGFGVVETESEKPLIF